MTLHGTLFAFFNAWAVNIGTTHQLYNTTNGIIHEEFGSVLGWHSTARLYLRDKYYNTNLVRMDHLLAAAQQIDQMYVGTTYRNVLTNVAWQQMYGVANNNVSYVDGAMPIVNNEPTVPCHECGIVVPLPHITIDHQKPQAGGATQAILKVFRAIQAGFTHAGPSGAKGFQVAAVFAGTSAPTLVPTKRSKVKGLYDPAWKYSLTTNGIAFLSAVYAAGVGAVAVLERECMHSVANLAPACFRCNAVKNNGVIDLSSINT